MTDLIRLDHAVITTARPEACAVFYGSLPGLEIRHAQGRLNIHFGRQKINAHLPDSGLYPLARNVMPGSAMLCLAASGEPGEWRQVFGRLGSPLMPGSDGRLMAVDPDGNRLCLEISQAGPMALRSLAGLALCASDMQASLDFYGAMLGMKEIEDAGGRHTLAAGSARIRLLGPGAAESPAPGSADFCFLASCDIEEIQARLAESGAPFMPDPGIVPRHGAAGPLNSLYLRDPDGNLVEIGVPAVQ